MKTFVGFMIFLPFILMFSMLIFNSAFLKNQKREVVVEGKIAKLPYSELVGVHEGKIIKTKVAQHAKEYFLNVRINKDLFLIQTNEKIFNNVEKGNKIEITLQETRFSHKIYPEALGIKPISSEELANRQEIALNTYRNQLKLSK
jgi:hypothetical protein